MRHKMTAHSRVLKGFMVLCLCTVFLLGMAETVFAEDGTVAMKVDDTRLLRELGNGVNVSVGLYRLAGRTGEAWNFAEVPAFESFASRLTSYELALQSGSTPDLALLTTLSNQIRDNGINAVATGRFPAAGSLTFENLPEGLYFLQMTQGPQLLQFQSAIIPVPFTFRGSVHYQDIGMTLKVEWGRNGGPTIIPEYDTPLGIGVTINHVGDCYE